MVGESGDPYALLLRGDAGQVPVLRNRGPVWRSELGTWVITEVDLVARLLSDPRLGARHRGCSGPQVHPIQGGRWRRPSCHPLPLEGAALTLSGAEVSRVTHLAAAVSADGAVPTVGAATTDGAATTGGAATTDWAATAERVSAQHADRLTGASEVTVDGSTEVMAGFARPAAGQTLAVLLELPAALSEQLAEVGADLAPALDAGLSPLWLDTAARVVVAAPRIRRLVTDVVGSGAPGGGLIEELRGAARSTRLDVDDVGNAVASLAVAGVEMAVQTVGKTVARLLTTNTWSPELVEGAVEHTLRYDPPVRLVSLVAQEAVEVAGGQIGADDHVVLLVAEPEHRTASARASAPGSASGPPPLCLSGGPAVGLVAGFVRCQATAAIRVLATRFPEAVLAGDVVYRPLAPVTGGLLELPVILGRSAR